MLHVLLSIVAASDSKIWGVDYDGFGAALTCDATDFPTNYDDLQMMGLKLNKNPTDEDSCRDACCKVGYRVDSHTEPGAAGTSPA